MGGLVLVSFITRLLLEAAFSFRRPCVGEARGVCRDHGCALRGSAAEGRGLGDGRVTSAASHCWLARGRRLRCLCLFGVLCPFVWWLKKETKKNQPLWGAAEFQQHPIQASKSSPHLSKMELEGDFDLFF